MAKELKDNGKITLLTGGPVPYEVDGLLTEEGIFERRFGQSDNKQIFDAANDRSIAVIDTRTGILPSKVINVCFGKIDIVYEDDYLAVINKPAGLVTHPGAGNFSGTLVNGIMYHIKQLPNSSPSDRPGLVHRLDKNTSGLLVIAKTDNSLTKLQEAIQNRTVKRTYLAIICGRWRTRTSDLAHVKRTL